MRMSNGRIIIVDNTPSIAKILDMAAILELSAKRKQELAVGLTNIEHVAEEPYGFDVSTRQTEKRKVFQENLSHLGAGSRKERRAAARQMERERRKKQ
jgi:hypothetical protein